MGRDEVEADMDPGVVVGGEVPLDLELLNLSNIRHASNIYSCIRGCSQMTSAFFGVSDTP